LKAEKKGKKKKGLNIFGIVSPQNREHQKRYLFIYLFNQLGNGIPVPFCCFGFYFFMFPPTTTQKATTPFALTHEDMPCNHFRQKKKKRFEMENYMAR